MAVHPITFTFRDRTVSFKMDLDPSYPSDAAAMAYFNARTFPEPEVTHVMLRALREGDRAVDIGANIGCFTLLMRSLVGEKGHVLSVEPDGANIAKLADNMVLNGWALNLIEQPMWEQAEQVKFYRNFDDTGGHSLWDPAECETYFKTRAYSRQLEVRAPFDLVRATTLDAELHEPVRLIKIDVEGAEPSVIAGGIDFFHGTPLPYVVSELNSYAMERMGKTVEGYRKLMRSLGYNMFLLHPDGSLPSMVPADSRLLGKPANFNVLFSTLEGVAELWPEV